MNGIPSISHQVMKCILDKGTVFDINDDQLTAQKCMNIVVKGKGRLKKSHDKDSTK